MRRFDYHVPEANPEFVVAERLEAIAYDLERIALSLEGENPEGGPQEWLEDAIKEAP